MEIRVLIGTKIITQNEFYRSIVNHFHITVGSLKLRRTNDFFFGKTLQRKSKTPLAEPYPNLSQKLNVQFKILILDTKPIVSEYKSTDG